MRVRQDQLVRDSKAGVEAGFLRSGKCCGKQFCPAEKKRDIFAKAIGVRKKISKSTIFLSGSDQLVKIWRFGGFVMSQPSLQGWSNGYDRYRTANAISVPLHAVGVDGQDAVVVTLVRDCATKQ